MSILEEIKAGGKQTAELLWEQQRLGLEAHDLVETTRDFQLMRVNKELQVSPPPSLSLSPPPLSLSLSLSLSGLRLRL